jgi:hypothetical protein
MNLYGFIKNKAANRVDFLGQDECKLDDKKAVQDDPTIALFRACPMGGSVAGPRRGEAKK